MVDWPKFYEVITKPLPIASSLFLLIATSFLLFAGDSTLATLGLSHTIQYRWAVGLLFIIAASWLVVTALIWACKRGYQAWSLRRSLHALTVDERRVLSAYVENEVRTQTFVSAPDLGAAQGLSNDGILYRPAVAQDGAAVTYNIHKNAFDYLSTHRALVGALAPSKTHSGTPISAKAPDWFARSVALVAIVLTVIGLYFTHRTYTWQTKTYQDSLEEKILLRAGFKYVAGKKIGDLAVDVVNIGMHPIYVESVQIEVPCDPKNFPPPKLPVGCNECFKIEQTCSLMVYRRDPTHSNTPLKALDSGNEATYTMESWDFVQYPLQEWEKTKNLQDELWFDVTTTKNKFRQHPFSSWYQVNDSKGVHIKLP